MNYSIFTAGFGVIILMPMLSFMTSHVATPAVLLTAFLVVLSGLWQMGRAFGWN